MQEENCCKNECGCKKRRRILQTGSEIEKYELYVNAALDNVGSEKSHNNIIKILNAAFDIGYKPKNQDIIVAVFRTCFDMDMPDAEKNYDIVKLLLDNGKLGENYINSNKENDALYMAILKDNYEMVKILYDYGYKLFNNDLITMLDTNKEKFSNAQKIKELLLHSKI